MNGPKWRQPYNDFGNVKQNSHWKNRNEMKWNESATHNNSKSQLNIRFEHFYYFLFNYNRILLLFSLISKTKCRYIAITLNCAMAESFSLLENTLRQKSIWTVCPIQPNAKPKSILIHIHFMLPISMRSVKATQNFTCQF